MVLLLLSVFCVACRMYPRVESYVDTQVQKAELHGDTFVFDNASMHYWEGGDFDAPVVLFLHGFGGDALWAWSRNLADFTEQYHVIAPDLLWFGESTSQEISLQQQIDTLLALLANKGIEKISIVGLSYGGFVALGMTEHIVVDKMVLVGVGSSVYDVQDVQALQDKFSVDTIEDIFVPRDTTDIHRLLDICFYFPTNLIPKNLQRDLYQNVFGKYPQEQRQLITELVTNMEKHNNMFVPPNKQTDYLLILGKYDPFFTIEQARILQSNLDAELSVYSRAAHVPNVGYKRKFAKEVLHFLNTKDDSVRIKIDSTSNHEE